MKEMCLKDGLIQTTLNTDTLRELFPDAAIIPTPTPIKEKREHGVIILDHGTSRSVFIHGGCPNFQNGECSAAQNCLSLNRITPGQKPAQ